MLEFPFDTPPEAGLVIEVAPGILWARLPLPFRLDHVNVYFLADDDGWYIIDTGIANRECKAAWDRLLAGPLAGFSFKGLIVTHHHPDHIGLAGWLCERLDIPLLTSRTGFLSCMTFTHSPAILEASDYSRFYAGHGMSAELSALVATHGHDYLRMLSMPPHTYERLRAGDALEIGGRRFEILTGDGHCSEQIMLYARDEQILIAADQVIEKISPNVSVMAFEPHGNPLGEFIASLAELSRDIDPDVLVLSGHRLPFRGLRQRCRALIAHHEERCEQIRRAVADVPQSASMLVPIMFPKVVVPHEISFAFSEVLAHLNYMVVCGEIVWDIRDEGLHLVRHA